MNTWVVIGVTVVYLLSLVFTAWCAIELRAQLDKANDTILFERSRRRRTEEEALDLVAKVTPLIEKTDWMTGRWHGQFNTLVGLENKRNEQVDQARRALWSIPLVADHIAQSLSFGDHLTVTDHTHPGDSK